MEATTDNTRAKRKAVNLTIRSDVLDEAKALKLNASRAAENGLLEEIKKAHEQEWLENNKSALLAHNKRVDKDGVLLAPVWEE